MLKLKSKGKFESEVHIGLLAIIFLLLFLNFVSNVVIYRARAISRDGILSHLNASAVAISRTVQARYPESLTNNETEALKAAYRLTSLNLVPWRPADNSIEGRRQWFASIVQNLPPGQVPQLADKLIRSEYKKITRGDDSEYFYVYPIPAGAGQNLLITSVNDPALAFLDGSGGAILIVGLAAMLVVAVVYLLLYRFIFSPFRKIKEQARKAGRTVDEQEGEVDGVVSEYLRIIEELRDNEEKLLKLNKEIATRADSLEHFNEYLLSSIDSGMITVDSDGKVLSINRAAAGMISVDPKAYEAATCDSLFQSSPAMQACIDEAVLHDRVGEYREVEYTEAGGRVLTFGMTVSAIRAQSGQRIGFSILLNDLTELHHLKTELETKHDSRLWQPDKTQGARRR
jgi:PAS domain S-box-containing protein